MGFASKFSPCFDGPIAHVLFQHTLVSDALLETASAGKALQIQITLYVTLFPGSVLAIVSATEITPGFRKHKTIDAEKVY
eukprot:1592807-Amphidinium_carterae.1